MPAILRTEPLRRPRAVWWAVLAALVFVLAPILTHALGQAHVAGVADVASAQQMDICTTQGPQTRAVDRAHAEDSSKGPDSTPAQSHCPFCLHQADRMAPPPQLSPMRYTALGQQVALSGRAHFSTEQQALWSAPRGPPRIIGR